MRSRSTRCAGLWALALGVVVAVCGSRVDAGNSDAVSAREADPAAYAAHLVDHGQPADAYVLRKLGTYRVVVLGEEHGIRENCVFVAALLGPAYHDRGVRVFATEFVRTRDNDLVNGLVTAPSFDRAAAVELMRGYSNNLWGYREYIDIFEAVWRVNAELPDDAEPLRVVGLESDYRYAELMSPQTSPMQRMTVMRQREHHMLDTFVGAVVEPGHKALVHVGYLHSITSQGERFGTMLHRDHPGRAFQVALHHRMSGGHQSSEVFRLIERAAADADAAPVGFDVAGTAFGRLYDPNAKAFTFGGRRTLGDLAQGYVLLKPVDELQPVTWIEGFITEQTFAEALDAAVASGWADRREHDTAARLDARLREVTASR